MPANSVYQPTTVSFESSNHQGGLLQQTNSTSRLKIFRKPLYQILILILGLFFLVFGFVLITVGTVDYVDSEENKADIPDVQSEETNDVIFIIFGSLLLVISFAFLGLYIKVAEWRRNCICPCPCGLSKKQQQQQILALNPSTDPLVTHTQYAPVSEIPTRVEDEERRNLMPDNKDCLSSAEESDRMLDSDPRIVLRPTGHVEDA